MTTQLTATEVAARLGITIFAVRAHRQRHTMPAPDGYLGRVPWWWEATIDAWAGSRRSRGQQAETWTAERRAAHSERMKAARSASGPLEEAAG